MRNMDKDLTRELQICKLDVESLQNELQKMFEELRGKNNGVYISDLNNSTKHKRETEVLAQLIECYRVKKELFPKYI